jgi:hypothetical protein
MLLFLQGNFLSMHVHCASLAREDMPDGPQISFQPQTILLKTLTFHIKKNNLYINDIHSVSYLRPRVRFPAIAPENSKAIHKMFTFQHRVP